jgi:hypothetical protein
MSLSAILKSLTKTAVVVGTGVGVPLALSLTSSTPTGGFAAYLGAHPSTAAVFGLLAIFAHNYLSQVQSVPASQVTPTQALVSAVVAEAVAPLIKKV